MEETPLEVSVVLYNTKSGAKEDLTNLCQRDIQVPKGFSLKGGQRKFIVLIAGDRNKAKVVVAIGEPLNDGYYYHKDILNRSKKDFTEFHISGGGQIDFSLQGEDTSWTAEFSGSSGDFGVFDQELLKGQIAESIAKAMKMSVAVKIELNTYAAFRGR